MASNRRLKRCLALFSSQQRAIVRPDADRKYTEERPHFIEEGGNSTADLDIRLSQRGRAEIEVAVAVANKPGYQASKAGA